jgi:peptidoglycan/LPS O-acetylase OafA/YrhL
VAIQGGQATKLLLSTAPIRDVPKNSAVWIFNSTWAEHQLGSHSRVLWDGPLWTLGYELLCYIAVTYFGMAGLLGRRWFLPVAMALCWSALVVSTALELPRAAHDPARFTVMFLAGALIHQYRNIITARWSLVVLSVVIVLATSFLPDIG